MTLCMFCSMSSANLLFACVTLNACFSKGLAQITEEGEENGRYEERSDMSDISIPAVSTPQYNLYMKSLIKLLVGDEMLSRWLKKGMYI